MVSVQQRIQFRNGRIAEPRSAISRFFTVEFMWQLLRFPTSPSRKTKTIVSCPRLVSLVMGDKVKFEDVVEALKQQFPNDMPYGTKFGMPDRCSGEAKVP